MKINEKNLSNERHLLEEKFYRLYLIGFFVILTLPLVNLPPWFSPPDWGKTIVFRVVMSILIFIFLHQFFFNQLFRSRFLAIGKNVLRRENKVFWCFWLFVALFVFFFLATIFSLDIKFSLWGSPSRSGGFANFALYFIFSLLVFFVVKEKDWNKIWNFAIIIGCLEAVIAIFQQYGILRQFFIYSPTMLPGTIGGPSFLGLYLLLLGFINLGFAIIKKQWQGKVFHLAVFFLFSFVIFLTISQAINLALGLGFLYFLFFYPLRREQPFYKKLILIKVLIGIVFILAVAGILFLQAHPENPLRQNAVIYSLTSWGIDQSRISAWKVSLNAIKDRPVLGYGPENFSIGFDRFYDPALPQIQNDPYLYSSWWDRAHNFIFDIGVSAGVPALIIYLLLFGVLFWQLVTTLLTKIFSRHCQIQRIQSRWDWEPLEPNLV